MISKSKNCNPNYLCRIIRVKNLRKHPNADRLNVFTVCGNDVITSTNTPEGQLSVYFPLECKIKYELLRANNDFRKADSNTSSTFGLNEDPNALGGFFDKNCRVKAVKLRGQKSEGYVVPVSYLKPILGNNIIDFTKYLDEDFDTVNGVKIVEKYVVKVKESGANLGKSPKTKVSKIVEDQFRLHSKTEQLGRNLHKINPDSDITVTWKMHGTSFVSSKVLCKRNLKWYEKLSRFLGIKVQETEYSNIYSSRNVIKNDELNPAKGHYYGYDIYSDINDLFKNDLLSGETIYGEAVGFTKDGGFIQKGYDYKCTPGKFDVYIYRITHTTQEGKVIELPFNLVENRAEQLGVKTVPLIFSGKAKQLFTDMKLTTTEEEGKIHSSFKKMDDSEWREGFLNYVKLKYVNDQDSIFCNNKVAEEGIVIRIEGKKELEALKCKSFRFLEGETKALDRGETNLEDDQ